MSFPVRVLYALWHYPHLSESYVRTEIRAARSLGVEIEVWSQELGSAPYPSEVRQHDGPLEKAVAEFRPHLLHTHWLSQPRHMPELRGTGLPVTVRGHGFDSSRKRVLKLLRDPQIAAVFPFPQFVPRLPWRRKRVLGIPVGFDRTLHAPGESKDRLLVMRAGVGLPTKDYGTFFEVARLCPRHRFVLALCPAYTLEHCMDEISELNRRLGEPVEIRIALQHEQVAALLREAGIYLHTTLPEEQFGMPISIAEAMASGCHLIVRDQRVARRYVGAAGRGYRNADEAAALVNRTLDWGEAEWLAAGRRSAERAFSKFVSTDALAPMVARWREIAGT